MSSSGCCHPGDLISNEKEVSPSFWQSVRRDLILKKYLSQVKTWCEDGQKNSLAADILALTIVFICCILRSGLHEIPSIIRTFPYGLENNHACKWISVLLFFLNIWNRFVPGVRIWECNIYISVAGKLIYMLKTFRLD